MTAQDRPTFGYESFMPVAWEQDIRASLGESRILRLLVADAHRDVRLHLQLASELPRQKVQIRVDDEAVQDLVLSSSTPTWQEIPISRRLIAADGRIVVELSSEAKISLSRLRVSPAAENLSFIPCSWNQEIGFQDGRIDARGLAGFCRIRCSPAWMAATPRSAC